MGIKCAPLVVDLYFFCYEKYFMLSLSGNNPANVICYLDYLPNINNPNEQMVGQIISH